MKLRVTSGHPRLYLTPDKIADFRKRSNGPNKAIRDDLLAILEPHIKTAVTVREHADRTWPEFFGLALGQAWQLTKDKKYGRAAFWLMGSFEQLNITSGGHYDYWGTVAESAAHMYDWLYDYWKQEGQLELMANITAWLGRRALDMSQHYYILEDWHNYQLGLHAGALAAALAIGNDFPKIENGEMLRTLHAMHFTGLKGDSYFVQDGYYMPKTVRSLDAGLRAGDGSGFAGHLEATGGYHGIDGYELTKIAELWTHGLHPSSRGNKQVWPEVERVAMAYINFLRPDGFCVPWGDSGPQKPNRWPVTAALRVNARAKNPHVAKFVEKYWKEASTPYPIAALLYLREPPKPIGDLPPLPTAVKIDPITMLRSTWESDATVISFRCGKWAGNHNSFDSNSFQIYRGGALAIDSGSLDYGNANRNEYYARSLAHNAILVRNPDEPYWLGKHAKKTVNDGGQRLINVAYKPPNDLTGEPHGVITEERRQSLSDEFYAGGYVAFEPGDKIDYVAGDATWAYTYPWSGVGDNPSRRVEEAVRQIVFLKPDLIVVFDRVEATKKHFEKKWLLHTMNAPTVFENGQRRIVADGISQLPAGPYEFSHDQGRLTVWPVLPADYSTRAVGGKDHEFWVDHAVHNEEGKGQNYPLPKATNPEAGAWRIEISPKQQSVRDCFLTVLHAGMKSDAPVAESFRCEATTKGETVTLSIEKSDGGVWVNWATLTFRTSGPVEVACAYANEKTKHKAPAPKRVPAAKRR